MYSYDNSSFTWAEQHLYGSSRLGMVTPGLTIQSSTPLANANYNSTGDPITNGTEGKRIYELTNHLGNVMVTISDRKTGVDENGDAVIDYYKAEVLTAQDYYAFGMLMPGRTYSNAGAKYKYGFNGKENDNEVKGDGNQQDYGMRIYDPRLGRFLSVDPIAKSFPMLTPYQFASNNPIYGIDQDGLEILPGTYDYKNALYIGNLTVPDDQKMNSQQIETFGNAMNEGSRNGIATGMFISVDVYFGGRISSFMFSQQLYSVFEHQRMRSPEGKMAQDERIREKMADAFLSYSASKVFQLLGYTGSKIYKYSKGAVTGDRGVLLKKVREALAGDIATEAELRVAKLLRNENRNVHFGDVNKDHADKTGTFDFMVDGQ